MFRVGMKVVCVNDDPFFVVKKGRNASMDGLRKGAVYAIRATGVCPCWLVQVVWLDEIVREIEDGFERYGELGFGAARFRPIVEKKTDISIFTSMLTPAPKKVTEPA